MIIVDMNVREILQWVKVSGLAYSLPRMNTQCCFQAQDKQKSGLDIAHSYVLAFSTRLAI